MGWVSLELLDCQIREVWSTRWSMHSLVFRVIPIHVAFKVQVGRADYGHEQKRQQEDCCMFAHGRKGAPVTTQSAIKREVAGDNGA